MATVKIIDFYETTLTWPGTGVLLTRNGHVRA
jgi:hypothetical protein